MGQLTTHVLDTANGRPAPGIPIRLYSVSADRQLITAATTNQDGRTDEPLLNADTFQPGTFELVFKVADYFAGTGATSPGPPFLNDVVIRFTVAADEHYHVPLLVSPWSYSTYRGS